MSENKLRKLPPTREALQLHILHSAYTAGWIWGATLQPSDQIPSPVHWGWNYSKDNRFAVDWCRTYDVNLMNTYLHALAKDFALDENVWRRKYHAFRFVVMPVLHHKKILLDSLFIHIQRCI